MAFLFLTRGKMPLEPAWREFFSAAALLEPVDMSRLWAPAVVAPREITLTLAAIHTRDSKAARGRGGRLADTQREVGKAVLATAKRASQAAANTASRQTAGAIAKSAVTDSGRRRLLSWTSRMAGWGSEADEIAAQDMFSVYVHPPPGYRLPKRSLFSGHEVADRVKVSWAQHSVVRRTPQLTAGLAKLAGGPQPLEQLVLPSME